MEDGSLAVAGSRSSTHLLAGLRWKKCIQGVTKTIRSYEGECGGLWLRPCRVGFNFGASGVVRFWWSLEFQFAWKRL